MGWFGAAPCVSRMSSDHLLCLSTGSTERPISLTPRLSNSGFSFANAPSSVVHTGVKSFGCENSSAQLLPIQSWNLILPSVVWASKSGATAPICRAIVDLLSFKLGIFLTTSIGGGIRQVNDCLQKRQFVLRGGSPLAIFFHNPRPWKRSRSQERDTVAKSAAPWMPQSGPNA